MKASLVFATVIGILGAQATFGSELGTNGALNSDLAYEKEYQRAIQGVLANIQSTGGIAASPSKSDPNYFYNWIRDTGLTMKTVITLAYDETTPAPQRKALAGTIERWINWELGLQATPKLKDLGEPRFNLDGTANNDPWNRPQNDGPGIRAQAAILVAQQWLKEGRRHDVEARLYTAALPANTLIKRDLEYVAHHWSEESFDLWEEEMGMHFYTLTMQKVALQKGAELAKQLNDNGGADFYNQQARAIDTYLEQFVDQSSGVIRYALQSSKKLPQKYTNLDISVVLASIETFDGQFHVPVQAMEKTVPALMAEFKKEYAINQRHWVGDAGVALGRYPGDRYSGTGFSQASPWFLSTLAVAEYYCDVDKVKNRDLAMAQFKIVHDHMGAGGELSEQFNRETGYQQGARDLTWSYAAYITAYRACFQ